ncbi:MAG: preprotein translocase subunit YajC [Bacteroidales bacterium]
MMNEMFQILAAQQGENPLVSLWPLLLIIVVFYLFMIRPQVKRQKELRKYRENLSKGDKIVTTGGIYGKIVEISDQAVVIEVEDQSKIKIDKNAILKNAREIGQSK